MPRFRYSKALRDRGLGYHEQGFMYFLLRSPWVRPGGRYYGMVREVCAQIGGEDADALYEFLTDRCRNHIAVSVRYYISEKRLFKLKNAAYAEIYKRIRGEA